ncbi:hypothetical protein GH714_032648 [Hevea brasiliensis]|uniref:Uncharacterized protein n=1 Tax=Hevea brasiliensis TaxID=3981 RepID=A0A6A6L3X4_HEVBR|nr:hypothetical protein GH714_032648 [Hevea brasiliensis]
MDTTGTGNSKKQPRSTSKLTVGRGGIASGLLIVEGQETDSKGDSTVGEGLDGDANKAKHVSDAAASEIGGVDVAIDEGFGGNLPWKEMSRAERDFDLNLIWRVLETGRTRRGDAPSLDSSSSTSSSSDSEVKAEATEDSDDHAAAAEAKENDESCSLSSGFINEDDGTGNEKQIPVGPRISGKHGACILNKELNGVAQKESPRADMPDFLLKFKSVYKCRICPQIVCLTEETMRTHLNSKIVLKIMLLINEFLLL